MMMGGKNECGRGCRNKYECWGGGQNFGSEESREELSVYKSALFRVSHVATMCFRSRSGIWLGAAPHDPGCCRVHSWCSGDIIAARGQYLMSVGIMRIGQLIGPARMDLASLHNL
ncbi:hypothetical protein BOTBODRAFT_451949 [Botryobasidium botryosum FD-172 SS1]|uniref:Uncharacterized protein n=1 Tax=Botryobasidium botryosum (strain FD-172 SS1) TaxID=930990 RepID=A0A067M6X8_BOTB1|nr:hypothetical protein BOTBODRAFT_451949 [Botryobasidium botryosum FD-172 SS1]